MSLLPEAPVASLSPLSSLSVSSRILCSYSASNDSALEKNEQRVLIFLSINPLLIAY